MRTQGNIALGIAAAALVVTACGTAINHPGGTPGGHVTQVSARNAAMGTSVTDREDLALAKRQDTWVAGDRPRAQRPQEVPAPLTAQRDLARVKLIIESRAAEQARSR